MLTAVLALSIASVWSRWWPIPRSRGWQRLCSW